jgi:hypothetical protein
MPASSSPSPPSTKFFRFDAGTGRGSELAPGRGSLLRSFGVWSGGPPLARKVTPPKPPVPERRADDRHRVECLAWVGWKTWRQFQMRDAVMIDLSRGGARIFLDEAPPAGRPVWVFIETPAGNTVVRGHVLELHALPSGQCVARLAFDEPCPYAMFEAAVCGLAPVRPTARGAALAPAGRQGMAG